MTAHLAQIVEASEAAIFSVSRDGKIESWNAAAVRTFGYPADEAVGTGMGEIFSEETAALYQRALRGESFSTDALCQHRSGEVFNLALALAPIRDETGAITGVSAVMHAAEFAERQFLQGALLEASERESRRIGQELHDSLCQHLLGAAFVTKALANSLPPALPAVAQLDDLARLINSAVTDMHNIARGLNPVDLDSAGLMAALLELTQQRHPGMECRLECARPVLLPDSQTALHLYRIAQEAISNAIRHSGGTKVIVRLEEDGERVTLQISDDGCGFPPERGRHQGLGLASMKYRAHALKGRLWLDKSAIGGATILCVFPKPK